MVKLRRSLLKMVGGLRWDYQRVFHDPKFNFDARPNLDYWHDRGSARGDKLNAFQQERLRIVIEHLGKNDHIFDVGSGTGETLGWLKEKGFHVTASDFNASLSYIYKVKGIEFVHLEADNISTQFCGLQRPDFVTFFEVLEHIDLPEKILLETIDVVKKGIMFSIPNSTHYSYLLRMLLRGRFLCQWRVHPREHVRFWGLNDVEPWLVALLKSRPVSVEVIPYQRNWLLGYICPHLFSRAILVVVKNL